MNYTWLDNAHLAIDTWLEVILTKIVFTVFHNHASDMSAFCEILRGSKQWWTLASKISRGSGSSNPRRIDAYGCHSNIVCPSVTFIYREHIRWNTAKIISRPNSLRSLLTLIWCNGNTPKLGWNSLSVWNNYMRVAYLQSWCTLSALGQSRATPQCNIEV